MPVQYHDFTGEQYGDLTVISRGPDRVPKNPKSKNSRRRIRWNCKCKCDKEMLLDSSEIRDPKRHTCHHLESKSVKIGDQFGDLTVIEKAPDHISPTGIKKPQWVCQCTCGNKITVQQRLLKRNRRTHCGCKKKPRKPLFDKLEYDLSGEYGIGRTRQGDIFLFDIEDYDKIKDFNWYYNEEGYIQATTPKRLKDKYPKVVRLHKLIMPNAPDGHFVDHIEHDSSIGGHKFDNRKSNLRYVTHAQNMQNKGLRIDNTSGEINIQLHKTRIEVCIVKDKISYTQTFPVEKYDEAIAWRNAKRKELFGDADFFVNNN